MQTMGWSERTRMNQIDERVGLQAVLTRVLSSLLWGGFFSRERKREKINSASFTFVGSAFGYLDLVYV
jgi:hypothetical protein